MVAWQKVQAQQLTDLVTGQQELIRGQQAIQKQLRFANMMNMANFIKLDGIADALGQ